MSKKFPEIPNDILAGLATANPSNTLNPDTSPGIYETFLTIRKTPVIKELQKILIKLESDTNKLIHEIYGPLNDGVKRLPPTPEELANLEFFSTIVNGQKDATIAVAKSLAQQAGLPSQAIDLATEFVVIENTNCIFDKEYPKNQYQAADKLLLKINNFDQKIKAFAGSHEYNYIQLQSNSDSNHPIYMTLDRFSPNTSVLKQYLMLGEHIPKGMQDLVKNQTELMLKALNSPEFKKEYPDFSEEHRLKTQTFLESRLTEYLALFDEVQTLTEKAVAPVTKSPNTGKSHAR